MSVAPSPDAPGPGNASALRPACEAEALSHFHHRATDGTMSVIELITTAEHLRAREQAAAALALYQTWIVHNKSHPLFYAVLFNYGVSRADAGDLVTAAAAYEQAAALNEHFLAARINLGTVRERMGQLDQAVTQWLQAANAPVGISAETLGWKITAWKQLGRVLEAARCEQAAENALRTSLELDPGQPDAIQHWIALRQAQCKWPVIENFAGMPRTQLMAAMSPLSLAAYSDDPILQLANAHRSYRHDAAPAGPMTLGSWPQPACSALRRMRIGYLSSDLREHAVGFLTSEIFEHHDRDKTEIFAYYTGIPVTDGTQQRIRATVDHWTDVVPLSDKAAASTIINDKIDILIDLNGYTRDARTKVVALRPAPVIVNWLGYPGSMGSPHHQYLIADRHIIPLEHEAYYSEKVLRLPCYQPNDRKRIIAPHTPSRAECGLPDEGVVYCCFNGANKLTRPVLDRWLQILKQVPGSVLWLLATNEDTNARLRGVAQDQGVAPERIVFAGRLTNPKHLARYRLADVFLDTTPYGAHTTASDALWLGVPVVTYAGESFPARVCASLVHAAGLSDLVCRDAEHYTETAVRLGQDGALRGAFKYRLQQNRDSCVLFDTKSLVRNLETLYAQMWQDYCQGNLPTPNLTNLPLYHEAGCEPDREHRNWTGGRGLRAWYETRFAYRNAISALPEDAVLWHPTKHLSALALAA